MSQAVPIVEAHAQDDDTTRAPAGYTAAHVELCKKVTGETVASMKQLPGHVALSVLITTYMQIAAEYGAAAQIRAAEYMVMTGSGFLNQAAAHAQGSDIDDPSVIASAITGFLAPRRHGPTLDAVLQVFGQLAEKFPCCTAIAADNAATVSKHLAAKAAARSAPPSLHVH